MDNTEPCCGDDGQVFVYRVLFVDPQVKQSIDYMRAVGAKGRALVSYKALSKRNGNNRSRSTSSNDGSILVKANLGRQIGSSIASTLIPGDLSPVRSPVRSAAWRTVTPGFGGGRGGSRPGENRAHRCPEGYQYGGRFTDNRLSTCGAKLFGIPSPLRAIASALRAASTPPSTITGRTATGVAAPSDIIARRDPQIPRVGNENRPSVANRLRELREQMGKFSSTSSMKVSRMIRKDGFVLEPVVPASVLRAIPDNRDMEGATYLTSALKTDDIGGEELGLLSNTGIRSLVYVMPGGSTMTIEKARPLTVGERRKLGRTVNSAMKMNNAKDPATRLRFVSNEIGEGIRVTEAFQGVQNPNAIVNGRRKWIGEVFAKRKSTGTDLPKPLGQDDKRRGTSKRLITNFDNAVAHLSNGGEFGDIDPRTLAKVLASGQSIERQDVAEGISAVIGGGRQYFLYEAPKKNQHLAESFAAAVQKHLGLYAPDIIFAEGPKDTRKYLREDVELAVPGGRFNPNLKLTDVDPADIARMAVADFLTDQRERQLTSIYPIDAPEGARIVLAQNTTSGLIDLSKIQITERMKMRISDFYESKLVPSYSEYYQALKAEQRILFLKFLAEMIDKARSFNSKSFGNSLMPFGISTGERIHMNIMDKLFASRMEMLRNQKSVLRNLVRGQAQ